MFFIPALGENNAWDRTETLTPNTSIKCITPIGEVKSGLALDSLCMERAKELAELAESTGKKLYVFWSGGLDSTAVFLCLREFCSTDNLGVLYTKASLKEYPGFFEANIQNKFESREFTMTDLWSAVDFACVDNIAVTGEIADQIFGAPVIFTKTPEELQRPWQEFDAGLCGDSRVHSFVERCPVKVENVAQFLWWFNYATRYQNVQICLPMNNTSSIVNKNMFHFFDTQAFNDYAVSTDIEEKLPGYNFKSYKKPLRNLIFKLSGDAEYAYTKPKVRSLMPTYGRFSKTKLAKTIDLNWVRGYK